jgi:hypothetical protein
MYIFDHRHRHVFTLDGPVHLVSKLNHCPDPRCPGHSKTKSPEIEPTIALPGWGIAWDVFCWIGHRRFSLLVTDFGEGTKRPGIPGTGRLC